MAVGCWPNTLRVLFSYTQDSRETTLAEAPASFSGRTPSAYCFFTHRIPGSWLSLRRRPHFRASARSESCSRCSAGLISALPLVPNRAPAAALASFLRFRSFRIVLPLQRWPHFPCHATPTSPGRPAPPLPSTPVPAAAALRPRPPSFSPAHLPADPALIAPGPLWGSTHLPHHHARWGLFRSPRFAMRRVRR